MSCCNPLIAIKRPSLDKDGLGKWSIKILSKDQVDSAVDLKTRYGERLIYLPCGHCEACKMAYRKDWSVRCEMESLLHKNNCMVTLTYNDDSLPDSPNKQDVLYFIRRLRKDYHLNIRYFGCGEIGRKGRFHHHLILFGYRPEDLKFYGFSDSGNPMFSSKFLDHIWNKGRVMISEFDIRTASYVAGYVNKNKNQCYLIFSTHPGIGFFYMHDKLRELFRYGHYQGKNGQVHRLPRYFDKICQKCGYDNVHIKLDNQETFEELNKASKFNKGISQDVELFKQQGSVMKDKLHRLKRGL